MKICPKCTQSFADGFKYCPKDATPLMKYDLRSRMQPEYHFLLENRSLAARLKGEIVDFMDELKRNPLNSSINLLRGEGTNRRRRNLLHAGMATAVITYSSIVLIALLIGVFRSPMAGRVSYAAPPKNVGETVIKFTLPPLLERTESVKSSGRGRLGGSLQTPKEPGGGGGAPEKLQASRGRMPAPSLAPQINLPDLSRLRVSQASLIVPETVYADPAYLRRLSGQIGINDGQVIPSPGNGSGTAIGSGHGPGYNSGIGGNLGGGPSRFGGGIPTGTGDDDGIPVVTPNLKPTVLYKERARYTDEARQYRVQGVVVLSATFGSDGRIHNIRVQKGLPHGLTESAIEAVQRIRFQPAMHNGRPMSVKATLEYNFNLY